MPTTSQLLLEFSKQTGVSGAEHEAARYGGELLSRFGQVESTSLGSVLCRVREAKPGKPMLLLDAHLDEVGLIITCIEESGFLRVAACGGVDRRTLYAAPVIIQARSGPVYGVVCSTPPHLAGSDSGSNPKAEELAVDIGCSKERAQELVSPGDRVTIHAPARELLDGFVSGRAIDDRAGCVAIVRALELLEGSEPDCGIAALFSVQEEVGGQGARTAAWQIAPTHALVVDVSFAHTPDAPRAKCGLAGKGPMIGWAPVLSREISEALRSAAERDGIPYQCEVMGGKTGTNADQIVTVRTGVATGLVSIPQKYMHTPVETVHMRDIEDTARLIASYVKTLGGEGGIRA